MASADMVLEGLGQLFAKLFFNFGSATSITSLACALAVAVGYVVLRRVGRGRKIAPGSLLRAILPRRVWSSPSMLPDIFYFVFNKSVLGLLIGWAVLAGVWVSGTVVGGLTAVLGRPEPVTDPSLVFCLAVTVWLFLAYEIGYWLDHWSSHRFSVLWEFHKVHHSAEVLTPLTVFRVHPVELWKFSNIMALVGGTANGIVIWAAGPGAFALTIAGTNAILVIFIHTVVHLQHSHVWIPFRGLAGRLLLSPAHHQVHHSSNPAHFDKNFGSCLAIWDWAFGTLYVPAKANENLSFGVEAAGHNDHSVKGVLIAPFIGAAAVATKALGWDRATGGAAGLTSSTGPGRP